MKDILALLTALLLSIASHLFAQQAPEILSSAPLPSELANFNSWQPGMTQCDSDGNLLVLSSSRDELLKVAADGGIILRIPVSGLPGLGEAQVRSFAPAPNGELYGMALQVFHKEVEADPSQPPLKTRRLGELRFLRFDPHGELIASKRFDRHCVITSMAVFDSGDFLMVDYHKPVARLYSADGELLKQVDLGKTALVGHSGDRAVSLLASGDKAFILGEWWNKSDVLQTAAVVTVSSSGAVIASNLAKLPTGYNGRELRVRGEYLFGALRTYVKDEPHAGGDFVELAPQTGELVSRFKRSPNQDFLGCETSGGMSILNLKNHKLEVMALPSQQ